LTGSLTKKKEEHINVDMQAMRSKIDTLMARLDDLENRTESVNPQLEMLSFIMTGLFLMFALDLTVKKLAR
jgi:tetrahydromethanopterin S-methyltransferase subunit B